MKKIIDLSKIERIVLRIAYQIIEDLGDKELAIIGVRAGGIPIAKKLKEEIEKIKGETLPYGELDISLYRSDMAKILGKPILHSTNLPFSLKNKVALIVDDVIYSGRTGFEAIDALLDISRPAAIKLVALIETGVRELPVSPDYLGKRLELEKGQRIKIKYNGSQESGVYIT